MGKAYANRKPVEERPVSDFYETPRSLVWELKNQTKELSDIEVAYEPACGNFQIAEALKDIGINAICDDLVTTGVDFLDDYNRKQFIITNPPFSLFDEFVFHSKEVSSKFILLGKTNFFGAAKRNNLGIWNNLKSVHIFNRMIDYRTTHRSDGFFNLGMLVTGWFCWDMNYTGKPMISILDVNKYAKLGPFKE